MKTILNGVWLLEGGDLFDPYQDKKKKGSILIKNGVVIEVGRCNPPEKVQRINCKGKLITSGFIDIHAHFRDPGREDKETLATGADSALAGGFTRVCVMPNTNPPIDSPESIRFIIEKAENLPIQIFPIGAITVGQNGRELAEIGKMVQAGAVAISDDGLPLQNGQLMRYALEYAQKYDVPVINHAEDIYLRNNGVLNEGPQSTRLGLPGIPDISESVMVHRDLEIAQFVDGRVHIPHVSTARSVELIRKYKKSGVQVTAEATPHHIGLNEKILGNFNTNAKVAPPLRTGSDQKSIINGLVEGTIDCIATDHAPHTVEEKEMDFIHAPCGMISLESAFGLSHTALIGAGVSTEQVIKWFTKGPARVMNWNLNAFQVGNPADLVVIDPNMEWEFKESNILSRSKNSPVIGMKFKGKVEITISGKYSFGKLFD